MSDSLIITGQASVDVERRTRSGKEKTHMDVKNTISRGGRRQMLAGAVANLFGGAGTTFGKVAARSTMFNTYPVRYSSNNSLWLQGGTDYKHALSCALLGLSGDAYDAIGADTAFLPLLAEDGSVDGNKVRALANIESAAGSTVGIADYTAVESVTNLSKIGSRYKFPAGTGEGTVTGVAMIPGSWAPGKVPYGGGLTFKKIENAKMLDTYTASSRFVAPGVDGLEASEVRMNYNYAGITSRKYDIYTGVYTEGASGDWFPTNAGEVNMLEVNGWIFTADYDATTFAGYDRNNAYNKRSTSFGSSTFKCGSLFVDPATNNVYFIYKHITSRGYTRYNYAYATYREAYGDYTFSRNNTDMTESEYFTWLNTTFGIVVPTAWQSTSNVYYVLPMTIGQYTGFRVGVIANSNYDEYQDNVYITSNKADVIANLVDIIPCTTYRDCIWGVADDYGVLCIGTCNAAYSSTSRPDNAGYTSITGSSGLLSNTCYARPMSTSIGIPMQIMGAAGGRIESGCDGLYLACRGQWFNWLSCLKLAQAQDKTGEADMWVQYDYTVN